MIMKKGVVVNDPAPLLSDRQVALIAAMIYCQRRYTVEFTMSFADDLLNWLQNEANTE